MNFARPIERRNHRGSDIFTKRKTNLSQKNKYQHETSKTKQGRMKDQNQDGRGFFRKPSTKGVS